MRTPELEYKLPSRRRAQPIVAYVSDEYHLAVPGAVLEVHNGDEVVAELVSSPTGAVHAELAPGSYDAVVACHGYGTKRTKLSVAADLAPQQVRLLSLARPLGYLWPKYVRSGESSELRVHAGEAYRLSLWRYGFTRELVEELGINADLHPPGALHQLLPDGDFTRTGVGWRPHPLAPRGRVMAPERSGLYYVHLKTASGAFAAFPWVVAPRSPQAPLAVLASDLTWNAYNDFGGRSNYISMVALPAAPSVSLAQENDWYRAAGYLKWDAAQYAPLSFDRPEPYNAPPEEGTITDQIEPFGTEHVGPAEWRLLGWLEREGFSYDLYAESQLAEGGVELGSYRALVLSAHPEYWTRAMFDSVHNWVVERGGRLLYLGGNGLDCEVSIEKDAMTVHNGEARRWMGQFESRFASRGARPGALLGVATTVAGMGTGVPYRVVAGGHWAFSGTGLDTGDLFGFSSLDFRNPGGASGDETDKLSADAPPGTVLLARGENPEGGGADMVMIEHASGGRVFSVSSISYPCCLPVDDQVSMVTRNVLTRFLDDGAGK